MEEAEKNMFYDGTNTNSLPPSCLSFITFLIAACKIMFNTVFDWEHCCVNSILYKHLEKII